jgi:hypothetical protein
MRRLSWVIVLGVLAACGRDSAVLSGASTSESVVSNDSESAAATCDALSPILDPDDAVPNSAADPQLLLSAFQAAQAVAPDDLQADLTSLLAYAPVDAKMRQPGGAAPTAEETSTLIEGVEAGFRLGDWTTSHCAE